MGDARENALGNERTETNGLGNSWENGDPGNQQVTENFVRFRMVLILTHTQKRKNSGQSQRTWTVQ